MHGNISISPYAHENTRFIKITKHEKHENHTRKVRVKKREKAVKKPLMAMKTAWKTWKSKKWISHHEKQENYETQTIWRKSQEWKGFYINGLGLGNFHWWICGLGIFHLYFSIAPFRCKFSVEIIVSPDMGKVGSTKWNGPSVESFRKKYGSMTVCCWCAQWRKAMGKKAEKLGRVPFHKAQSRQPRDVAALHDMWLRGPLEFDLLVEVEHSKNQVETHRLTTL